MPLRIATPSGLLCGLVLVLWPMQAKSTSIERVPLEGVVREAAIVARVRITDRQPVVLTGDEAAVPCGVTFTAAVIDQFKGKTDTFSFFATSDADFAGFDSEYLVVADARTDDQLRALRDNANRLVDEAEKKNLLCMLQSRYFVKSHLQMLIPFVRDTSEPPKEWLQVSRTSVVSEARFEQMSDVHLGTLVSWPDVEEILRSTKAHEGDPSAVQNTDSSPR